MRGGVVRRSKTEAIYIADSLHGIAGTNTTS